MLLYTVMPYDAIFPPQPEGEPEERPIPGGYLELTHTSAGYTVSRIDSTDPRMYLGRFAPGDRIPPGTVDTI